MNKVFIGMLDVSKLVFGMPGSDVFLCVFVNSISKIL